MEVGTDSLDVCDFSVLLTVATFFSEIKEVMDSSNTLGYDFPFLSNVSIVPSLSAVSIELINGFSISSKSPLDFLTFSLGVSYLLGNWQLAFLTPSLGASDFLDNGPIILDDMVLVLDIFHPVNSRISSRF